MDYLNRLIISAEAGGGYGPAPFGSPGARIEVVGSTYTRITTQNFTVNAPAGIQAGDLLCAVVLSSSDNNINVTAPVGWTEVIEVNPNNNGTAAHLSTKVAGTEPSTYSFTSSGTVNRAVLIVAFRNAYSIINVLAANDATPSTTTLTVNSVIEGVAVAALAVGTGPATFTAPAQMTVLGAGSDDPAFVAAYEYSSSTSFSRVFTCTNDSDGISLTFTVVPSLRGMYLSSSTGGTLTSLTTAWISTAAVTYISGTAGATLTGGADMEISVNSGAFASTAVVSPGDSLVFRARATTGGVITARTATYNGQTVYTVFIDSRSQVSTTAASASTALSYTYTDQSRTIGVFTGYTDTISITGTGEFQINAGTYSATARTVVNGDTVRARITSSSTRDTTLSSSIVIGGTSRYSIAASTTSYAIDTLGSVSFTVPLGVTSICIACIGSGGNGGTGGFGGGGGGGAYSHTNNIAVTSGETITGTVSSVGSSITQATRGATVLVSAAGGATGTTTAGGAGGATTGVGTLKTAGASGGAGDGVAVIGGGGGAASPTGNGVTSANNIGGNGTTASSAGFSISTTTTLQAGQVYGGGGAGAGSNAGDNGAVVFIWNGRTFSGSLTY